MTQNEFGYSLCSRTQAFLCQLVESPHLLFEFKSQVKFVCSFIRISLQRHHYHDPKTRAVTQSLAMDLFRYWQKRFYAAQLYHCELYAPNLKRLSRRYHAVITRGRDVESQMETYVYNRMT